MSLVDFKPDIFSEFTGLTTEPPFIVSDNKIINKVRLRSNRNLSSNGLIIIARFLKLKLVRVQSPGFYVLCLYPHSC